ncbi:MAG: strictosidine synthase [Mesorhizobium sp.]|nr:strictosidine synthase [Mesorhizobium sp.]MCO5162248.1 strictosidine synthase [Mesorhizobium sp.]
MLGALRNYLSPERGSTPVFDGVLRPNQELDLCRLLARHLGGADDIAVVDGEPVVSCGSRLLRVSGHWFAPLVSTIAEFDGIAGAIAATDHGLAVAVDGNRIVFSGGLHNGRVLAAAAGSRFSCITALAAHGNRLVVAEGSKTNGTAGWRRDLMEQGASGRVVEIDLASGRESVLAEGLAWASGVAFAPDGSLVVSESWRHRVRSLSGGKGSFDDIPAYPGRIAASPGGGYWLSCFATRTQLVDFVVADRRLAGRMMKEIDEEFWIAPTLAATDHPHEPTQLGGVKYYGARKPWAPARSYGLVIKLGSDLVPTASLHSRVDGKRHGITGVACDGERAFFVSKGNGKLMQHDIPRALEAAR